MFLFVVLMRFYVFLWLKKRKNKEEKKKERESKTKQKIITMMMKDAVHCYTRVVNVFSTEHCGQTVMMEMMMPMNSIDLISLDMIVEQEYHTNLVDTSS